MILYHLSGVSVLTVIVSAKRAARDDQVSCSSFSDESLSKH